MHSKSEEFRRTLCQHLCQEKNADSFYALFSWVTMRGHRNINHNIQQELNKDISVLQKSAKTDQQAWVNMSETQVSISNSC